LLHPQPTTVDGVLFGVGDVLVLAGACDGAGQFSHLLKVLFESGNVCVCVIPDKCGVEN